MAEEKSRRRNRLWYLLLFVPFVATLYPPFFASDSPQLWGFPFFYWYQFLWVPLSAILTAVVYFIER